jgi:enoyl-CoA hydratase/carnithine racemase
MPGPVDNHEGASGEGDVRYDVRDGVAYITMDRPAKLNALSDHMVIRMKDAFERFDLDDDARVAIIHGEGRAFSSGADVLQRQLRPREEIEKTGVTAPGTRELTWFEQSFNWKPIVSAVHGYALGIAFELAFMSEIVIVTESTKLQITEIPRGLGGSRLWSILTYRGAGSFADRVTFTGAMFSGKEAAENGLVTECVPDGEQLAVAERYAQRIAALPPLAIRRAVRIRRWCLNDQMRIVKVMSEPRAALHLSEDFHESAMAFAEKRDAAVFKGR